MGVQQCDFTKASAGESKQDSAPGPSPPARGHCGAPMSAEPARRPPRCQADLHVSLQRTGGWAPGSRLLGSSLGSTASLVQVFPLWALASPPKDQWGCPVDTAAPDDQGCASRLERANACGAQLDPRGRDWLTLRGTRPPTRAQWGSLTPLTDATTAASTAWEPGFTP